MFPSLHEDLQPYLDGIILRHPLVTWDWAYPALYGRLNRLYDHRRAVEAGRHTPNDWDLFLPHANLVTRLDRYLYGQCPETMTHDEWLSPQRLQLLGQCWKAPEFIVQTSAFWAIAGGDSADISAAMNPTERQLWEALPDSITVYRAYRDGLLEGCCWYPDRSPALAWAVGIPNIGLLATGTIAKQHVRAVFAYCGETEFIVDYRQVLDIVTSSHETCYES